MIEITRDSDGRYQSLCMDRPESERYYDLVIRGIDAVRTILSGGDTDDKLGLLFIMEEFMDPYFKLRKYIEPFHDELVELLQQVVCSPGEDEDVAEEAWHLLSNYECPPFEIIENRLNRPDSLPSLLRTQILGELAELRAIRADRAIE